LQAKRFERIGPDIMTTFSSAKHDQLHNGQQTCLVASPPSALSESQSFITSIFSSRLAWWPMSALFSTFSCATSLQVCDNLSPRNL
jgi:hypothetical protein